MIIKLPVLFDGAIGQQIVYTLFDSGATFSCIPPNYAEKIGDLQKLRPSVSSSNC
jgi:hypothetical protein